MSTRRCGGCGRTEQLRYLDAAGQQSECRACYRRDESRWEVCGGCSRKRPVNVRAADGSPRCVTCTSHERLRVCEVCGVLGRVALGGNDRTGSATVICWRCYRQPQRVCGRCGRSRRIAKRARGDQPDVCFTCVDPAVVDCSRCQQRRTGRKTVAHGAAVCFHCLLTERVDAALGDPARLPDWAVTIRTALVARADPEGALSNLNGQRGFHLLTRMVDGSLPVSHDSLDDLRPSFAANWLRSFLVAAGALEDRDEQLARLQLTISTQTSKLSHRDDKLLLASFARWHITARIRRRSRGRISIGTSNRGRAELRQAANFLTFLRKRDRCLTTCRQVDVDGWFADRRRSADTRAFLRWARRNGLPPGIKPPTQHRRQATGFTDPVTRWRLAKQLLTDPSIDPADRFAGCLVLLYAQPLTRIAALRRSAIRVSPDGTATLSLGREPVELPPPLAGLASHLPLRRTGGLNRPGFSGGRVLPAAVAAGG